VRHTLVDCDFARPAGAADSTHYAATGRVADALARLQQCTRSASPMGAGAREARNRGLDGELVAKARRDGFDFPYP